MKSKNNIRAIVLIFASMLIMSLTAGLKGVLVPVWKSTFVIDSKAIALLFTFESISYLLAIYFGGRLVEKIGSSKVLAGALATLTLFLLIIFSSQTYFVLCLGMLGQGIALGLVTLAINITVPNFKVTRKAVLMNLVHFCFGLGLATSQRLSGYFLYKNVSWRVFFPVLASISFILAIFVFFTELPQAEKRANSKSKSVKNNLSIYVGLIIMLGFYLIGEIGTSNWFVSYAVEGRAINSNDSSFYLSLFFMLFTGGRLVGGFIVEKMPYLTAIIGTTLISAFIYLFGIIRGVDGLLFISIAGFFQSIIYPTLMLTIAVLFKGNQARATANITAISHMIFLVGNNIIGILNDAYGVVKTFYVLPISMFISALASLIVVFIIKKQKSEQVISG